MQQGAFKSMGVALGLVMLARSLHASDASDVSDWSVAEDILAIEGDREYGAYLSSECTTCHQTETSTEIPAIAYWPREDFVTALHAYKDKVRPNPVMQMIAGRLSAEEIAALAAYFENPE